MLVGPFASIACLGTYLHPMPVVATRLVRSAVIDTPASGSQVGVRIRSERDGPEAKLVAEFMRRLVVEVPRGCKYTIFREPYLECGVPDLVVAVWRACTVEDWVHERSAVTPSDLRVLQYLVRADGARDEELRALHPRGLTATLDRLVNARLARQWRGMWVPLALSRSFALRRLIAVEAKVAGWSAVIQQARRNTWFACESYVLVPALGSGRRSNRTPPHGVRVCTPEDAVIRVRITGKSVPRCYASWLFNEWVLRAEQAQFRHGRQQDDH